MWQGDGQIQRNAQPQSSCSSHWRPSTLRLRDHLPPLCSVHTVSSMTNGPYLHVSNYLVWNVVFVFVSMRTFDNVWWSKPRGWGSLLSTLMPSVQQCCWMSYREQHSPLKQVSPRQIWQWCRGWETLVCTKHYSNTWLMYTLGLS